MCISFSHYIRICSTKQRAQLIDMAYSLSLDVDIFILKLSHKKKYLYLSFNFLC